MNDKRGQGTSSVPPECDSWHWATLVNPQISPFGVL